MRLSMFACLCLCVDLNLEGELSYRLRCPSGRVGVGWQSEEVCLCVWNGKAGVGGGALSYRLRRQSVRVGGVRKNLCACVYCW